MCQQWTSCFTILAQAVQRHFFRYHHYHHHYHHHIIGARFSMVSNVGTEVMSTAADPLDQHPMGDQPHMRRLSPRQVDAFIAFVMDLPAHMAWSASGIMRYQLPQCYNVGHLHCDAEGIEAIKMLLCDWARIYQIDITKEDQLWMMGPTSNCQLKHEMEVKVMKAKMRIKDWHTRYPDASKESRINCIWLIADCAVMWHDHDVQVHWYPSSPLNPLRHS